MRSAGVAWVGDAEGDSVGAAELTVAELAAAGELAAEDSVEMVGSSGKGWGVNSRSEAAGMVALGAAKVTVLVSELSVDVA